MPKISENELLASICKDSFYHFVREFWGEIIPEDPIWNWHIRYLCDRLQAMAERVFRGQSREHDLVINIPPGTTKSTICSVMFPAWIWTRMRSARFIGASYTQQLAEDLAIKTRDIVTSDKYQSLFPTVRLREDQNTKKYFRNTAGGYRYAVGSNGKVTGMHGHFIVIDDPLDPNEAASPADLKATNRWIKETLPSRKVDKRVTPTILVMQRLHQDDPTALFLARKRIAHIKLPAERKDGVLPEELGKNYRKGLLDPIRLSKQDLKDAEDDLGEYGYASQFRQSPVPAGGGKFKVGRLKILTVKDLPKKWEKVIRAWDKAGTYEAGDYTAGVKMGKSVDGRYVVLDVQRKQLDSWLRERLIRDTAESDGYSVRILIEQSGGEGGKDSAEATVMNLAGFRVKIVKRGKSTGDKENRAEPFSSQVNGGNVYLLEGDWNEDFIEELKYFPFGKYDDQVDAASDAFNGLWRRKKRVGGLRGKTELQSV
jgi:predicted phage terminase large subunit-like protein